VEIYYVIQEVPKQNTTLKMTHLNDIIIIIIFSYTNH